MELFYLENKVAIVTGALGLLGREHCRALAEAGANVVVADLDESACRELASTLPGNAIGVSLDITLPATVVRLKQTVMEEYGRLDILVNNAAVNDMVEDPKSSIEQSKFENYPLHLWNRSLNVNVTGVFICSRVLGAPMVEQGRGSIINIASTYGMVAPDQSLYRNRDGNQVFFKPPAYPVTKGAVLAFTRYLAAYWGESGVRVNALSPGGVENGQDDFFIRSYASKTPLKRMAHPTDYRGAIVFLASDASSYMTGANLVVDGGWTVW